MGEANKLISGLLIAYPDDARLTKAKGLLEKLVVAAKPADVPVANNAAAASATPPAVKTDSTQLTGMDKLEYNSLIELGRQAQQSTDLDQQKKLLQQFMDQSDPFLQKHPDILLVWQLRAAAAMSLNNVQAGYDAGHKLLAMGAADSNDPSLQKLLSQLKIKGWLDASTVLAEQHRQNLARKIGWLLGTWNASWEWEWRNVRGSRGQEVFEIMEPNVIVGYEITGAGDKCIDPDLRGIISDSGEIKWECYLPPGDSDLYFLRYCEDRFQVIGRKTESSDFYRDDDVKKWVFGLYGMKTFYPSGWQPLIGYETSSTKDTIKMTIPLQTADPKSEKHYKYPPTLIFTKGNSANAGISTGKQAKKRRSLFDTAVEQATDK